MFDSHIKDKLKEFNHYLDNRENLRPSNEEIRNGLSNIGEFIQLKKLTPNQVSEIVGNKGIVGVDGTYTTYGGNFPNIIFLAQALAKYSFGSNENVKKTYLETGYTYLENASDEGRKEFAEMFLPIQRKKVAQLEVEVATEALHKYDPFLTMFDGGFWRFTKDAEEQWDKFVKDTLEKETLCVGVIEDSGSYDIHDNKKLKGLFEYFITDSDILFGVLNIGEVFILDDPYRDKFKRAFARFSRDPQPIACDFLFEQHYCMPSILNLIYNLTSEDSRGFPLWIDIVDKEVKFTEDATNLLIDNYLTSGYKEKYFTAKRNRR